MTIEQQADDVQAVIDALTEREHWVWVFSAQYDGSNEDITLFSTRTKAVDDALSFIRDAFGSTCIDAEMHDALEKDLRTASTSAISTDVYGILYLNIYRKQVQ